MSDAATPDWRGLENLVLVAGHAVYVAGNFDEPFSDRSWSLQEFQKGEAPFLVEHMRRGVELAAQDERSLLVFSGGQTRVEAGHRSEAQSYWAVANHFRWWQTNVSPRATTEEFARDSFENLLFGICRFHECAASYPKQVTVVSWGFKRERFALHRAAIRFPSSRFVFEGANDPSDLDAALRAETKNAVEPFKADPYGTHEPLAAKRRERNPFRRQPPYATSCAALAGLLRHQGRDFYEGALPWSDDER